MAAEKLLLEYLEGASKPDFTIDWYADDDGTIIDFSTGYTFTLVVSDANGIKFTKSSGITGAATLPNVTGVWDTSTEISTLTGPATYEAVLTAATKSGAGKKAFRIKITT